MYNIKLEKYVPKPDVCQSDMIIAAHYYAAWKKGAAEIHEGFEDLHEYPERTPLMGYYDEENPEVCDWEIKWALEHGINCFIHCWYRRIENTGKKVSVENLRAPHALHEAYFNSKYQDMFNFAIMFENSPRWGTTDEKDIVENLMPFWVENYFSKKSYLKIDNKPVLFVYFGDRLKEAFGSIEVQKRAFDNCREYAKKCGFDGMIFALCDTEPTKEAAEDCINRGYDFRFGYNSGYIANEHYPSAEEIISKQCDLLKKRLDIDPMNFVATPSCFSDPTPRMTQRWIDLGYEFFSHEKIWELKPEDYRIAVRKMKEMIDKLPQGAWGKKIFMIDNWNEWDEGHYVAPSHKYGFRYLQAIREELTKRNNLPDYRMPQDMGFTGYNKSWTIPDFKEFCEKKLNNK